MTGGFLSKPSAQQLRTTVLWTLFGLSLVLGLISLGAARFGPFRGTSLDLYLYLPLSTTTKAVIETLHLAASLGLLVVWLTLRHLRGRYQWLCVFPLLLAAFVLVMPR